MILWRQFKLISLQVTRFFAARAIMKSGVSVSQLDNFNILPFLEKEWLSNANRAVIDGSKID